MRLPCLTLFNSQISISQFKHIINKSSSSSHFSHPHPQFKSSQKPHLSFLLNPFYLSLMAISKPLVASLVFSLFFFFHLVQALDSDQTIISSGAQRSLLGIDCAGACKARCQLSSRPNLCNRACGTCCYRCQCVPKGTSGNLDECPCYANMTTHGGKRKCP